MTTDTRHRDGSIAMVVPAVVVAALLALRNHAAVFRAEFWAEDGTEFFSTALAHGASSLWTPVYGYYLSLARLIAWCATFFPVLWTPYIYAAASLVVNAFTLAYFSREGFAWLIPRRGHRILVCALLTVAPGGGEVFLNISNLTNCLALLAILMLLETPRRLGWPKFAALVLIGLSSGHLVILLPLILFLGYRTRDRRYFLLVLALLPVIAANALGNQAVGDTTGLLDYSRFWMAPVVMAENFLLRLLVAPFLGGKLTGAFMTTPAAVFWPVCLGGLALLLLGARRGRLDREMIDYLGGAYLLSIGTFGIIVVIRSYAVDMVQRGHGDILWGSRYSFLPGTLATLFWMSAFIAWLREPGRTRRLSAIAAAGIVLICVHDLMRWHSIYRRRDAGWPDSARRIQEVLDRRDAGTLLEQTDVPGIRMHPMGKKFEWLTVTIPPSPGRDDAGGGRASPEGDGG